MIICWLGIRMRSRTSCQEAARGSPKSSRSQRNETADSFGADMKLSYCICALVRSRPVLENSGGFICLSDSHTHRLEPCRPGSLNQKVRRLAAFEIQPCRAREFFGVILAVDCHPTQVHLVTAEPFQQVHQLCNSRL